ncbi:MAG TPA: pilus assembly protein PilP [Burkholderiaceae bacterium]|jgi:type IV pilus assembly protein PilP|nr:pilus assembly protein PilP [Burkholderiaceae bacterium]
MRRRLNTGRLGWAAMGAAALLAGCGASDESELRTWMNSVKQSTRVTTQPVPPPKEFTPFVYDSSAAAVDPFDPQKILMAVARQQQARASASAVKPDLERRREVLEGFPLDQIRMVGMMRQGGVNVALLETNGSTHMVKVGNYLGQNFGVVTRITETELLLKEIVQDAAGEWVERPAKLELQTVATGPQQGSKR